MEIEEISNRIIWCYHRTSAFLHRNVDVWTSYYWTLSYKVMLLHVLYNICANIILYLKYI